MAKAATMLKVRPRALSPSRCMRLPGPSSAHPSQTLTPPPPTRAAVWAGLRDAPLTNHGFAQATRLGKHFAKVPITGERLTWGKGGDATSARSGVRLTRFNSGALCGDTLGSDLLLRPQAGPHHCQLHPPAEPVHAPPAADGLAPPARAVLWRRRGVSSCLPAQRWLAEPDPALACAAAHPTPVVPQTELVRGPVRV